MIHTTTWFNLQGLSWGEKKPISKGNILYASNNMTILKRQSVRDREQISACQESGKGE